MRLIDADEFFRNYPELAIEPYINAPTVEYPFYQEAYQTGHEEGQNERPQGEWIEFADFIARNVVSEDFSEDVDFYAEVLCRKLVKLGLVKLDGDTYKYCGADMRGKAE